jgi:hypothetical protein
MSSPVLSAENLKLLDLVRERDRLFTVDPTKLNPHLFRPCRVKVLLVTDDGLDFSVNGFGLRTFVETLLSIPGYHVKFDITLAHIDAQSGDQMMDPDPRIVNRIPQFKFDNAAHFGPNMYDQVWLFGISTFYSRGAGYPTGRLSDGELAALTQFMNGGGGLFATGDHGSLGVCLSGAVPRARSMRMWGPPGDDPASEVSMTRSRRNDTNRPGSSPGTQFGDQSDDVPQPIEPKLYHRRFGIFRFSYPHPLLCSPTGVIRVMPDHPHEGECVPPADPNQQITFVNPAVPEYPAAAGGGTRPLPEVISTSSVLAGNTADFKDPTEAQTFGGICAYDGHLAAIGRVVTDATWHHFVNINLVGDPGEPIGDPKRLGFLYSATGQAHLEQIKTYYRNLAVWLSRPSQIVCMQRRLKWGLLWTDRVMEAVMTRADMPVSKLDARILLDIGRHARDVLGRYVGACQARKLILYEIGPLVPKPWLDLLDPWLPVPPRGPVPEPDPVPWVDPELVLDIALGGALAALREKFPNPDPKRLEEAEKAMDEVSAHGAGVAIGLALQSYEATVGRYGELFERLRGVKADTKPDESKA